jgi:hypothetical protein
MGNRVECDVDRQSGQRDRSGSGSRHGYHPKEGSHWPDPDVTRVEPGPSEECTGRGRSWHLARATGSWDDSSLVSGSLARVGVRHRRALGSLDLELTLPFDRGKCFPPSVSHSRPIFTSSRDFDSETAISNSPAWSYG